MQSNKLRLTAVFAAAVAFVPIATPVQARVMLSECERRAWNECESVPGRGTPTFPACVENYLRTYCTSAPLPFPPPVLFPNP